MIRAHENIRLEYRGHVALLTIDRPKVLNALNNATLDELLEALAEAATHEHLRALIITGAGDRAFIAGADISEMKDMSVLEAEEFAAQGQAVANAIEAFPTPVIAAVNGFALGGGTELALACDLILCSPSAVFGQPEVKLGVIPGFGGTQRLSRLVGAMVAREIIFTGRNVNAHEAVRIGLALRVVADDDIVTAAMKLATIIARQGPVAVRLAKRAINENKDAQLSVGLASERTLFALCFNTRDQQEGMRAFLGKQKPVFKGE